MPKAMLQAEAIELRRHVSHVREVIGPPIKPNVVVTAETVRAMRHCMKVLERLLEVHEDVII